MIYRLKTTLFFIFISIFFSSNIWALNIDSLKTELKNSKSSSEKFDNIQLIVTQLMGSDNSEALKYSFEALKISEQINDSTKLADALDNLGEIYRRLGKFDSTEFYLNKSIEIKKKTKNETLHSTYNLLGKSYANNGNYEKSISSFMSALYLMEDEKNEEGSAFYLNNIGIVFDIQGIYDKALEYYNKSLAIKEKNNMQDALAASYNNIAIVYFNLDDYEKSLEYHQKALKENIRMDKKRSIARSYNNVGYAYIYLGNYNQALANLKIALKMRKDLQDNRAIAQTEINISNAYNELNLLDSAQIYAQTGINIAKKINTKEVLDDGYELLSEIYKKKKMFEDALYYFELHLALKDTLRDKEAFASIAEMEAKYNLVKKEKEIQEKGFEIEKGKLLLKQKERTILFYSVLFVIALILVFVIVFAYFQKRRVNRLLVGQNLLINKRNLILKEDKTKLTSELKDKTEILEKVYSDKQSVDLPEELLSLSNREMEVLSYLALGWTDKEISEKLYVSVSTTKTHLRRIYSKLLVKGRAGAVSLAHKYHIIGGVD